MFSFAPPSDLMPPRALMSSIARSAPMRSSWPCRAQGPDIGAIIAILTDCACARPIAGKARAAAERARPLAAERLVSFWVIHVPPLKALSFRRLGNLLSPFLTKVSLDYFVVTDHRLGRTACDQSSVVEHVKVINQLNHRLHRVLDDQDGHALRANLANGAENAVEIVVAEPGEGLVEQDQSRLRRESAGELHQPQLTICQPAGQRIGAGAEPDPVEGRPRHLPRDGIVSRSDKGADSNVFEDGHPREGAHHLKGAADAEPAYPARPQPHEALPGQANIAALGRQKAVNDIEECRLAGAVRADNAVQPTLGYAQISPVERPQPAERDADVAQHEQVFASRLGAHLTRHGWDRRADRRHRGGPGQVPCKAVTNAPEDAFRSEQNDRDDRDPVDDALNARQHVAEPRVQSFRQRNKDH